MSILWNVYYLTFLERMPPRLLNLLWVFLSTEIQHLDYNGFQQPQQTYSRLQNRWGIRTNQTKKSLWASLQDIKDLGVIDEVDSFWAVDAKIDLLLATRRSVGAELIRAQQEMDQCRARLRAANLEE
ncbi:uncharacterized protein FIBRA_09370 [Fibroporia radiculosa]|uniref:Uncharacterized protein n=1 Tax=Fibroporia radiculosa TaxID=599839 RepID=J7RVV6_9APHY|nr:uncharacterized protein FIBRA_09370 [Fibroporia radiculosa]CCM07050.1 predicted protein [Fibroporia radiculosa]